MKRCITLLACSLLVLGSNNIFARGFSGGRSSFSSSSRSSFSSPSRSSSSFSRSSRSSFSRPKTQTNIKSSAVQSKPVAYTNKQITKPKAVVSNRVTKAQNKKYSSMNKAAKAKYGTKANAEKAFKNDLVKKNKYSSKTPPAKKPDNIPSTVTINNTSVGTSYGMFPGGGYGYGYYDPMTHVFMALAVNHMIVNDRMMMHSGYGNWTPVHHSVNAMAFIVTLLISGVVIVIIVKVLS